MIDSGPQPPAPIPGARSRFSLDPKVAHLNHGSFGAVPIEVQRVQQRLRTETEANPMAFFSRGLTDRIVAARRELATFLDADPTGTALIGNVTMGAALVLQSLGLGPGDEVVDTDHGYGAVAFSIQRECRRTGATARTLAVPLGATDEEVVEIIRDGLVPGRTKLLIVDQLSSPTARLFPVRQIVRVARDRGVAVLVDGAHAPGMLSLVGNAVGADFWMGNLHKWAFAPRGTAALVVAEPWRDRMEPLAVSWEQQSGFPLAVEWQATLDYTAWLAAPEGAAVLRDLGPERVRAHNATLAAYGQQVVGGALGLAPDELPDPGGPEVSMRLIPLPSGMATTIDDATLLRQRIAGSLATELAISAWGGRGWLRLSAQVYNRAEEYDRLAEHLPGLLANC